MWTLAFGHHEDRSPTYGHAESREDDMAAFAKSWRPLCRPARAVALIWNISCLSNLRRRLK
jgi:hypothetical protein